MKSVTGIVASEGLAVGQAYILPEKNELAVFAYAISDEEIAVHEKQLDEAIEAAKTKLSNALKKLAIKETTHEILKTHLSMLQDDSFIAEVKADLHKNKMNVAFTLKKKVDELADILNAQDDAYMQARAVDIQDAFDAVLHELLHGSENPKNRFEHIPCGVILFASEIRPSEALLLRQRNIAGLVTEDGSATSHIAIMARSWGIPMLVGVRDCTKLPCCGEQTVVLDCDNACLICDASDEEIAHFVQIIEQKKLLDEKIFAFDTTDITACTTADGIPINLAANIALPDEVKDRRLLYANEVGLFRTEFLVLDKEELPDEEEQFRVYAALLKSLNGKAITIRTFDIGADKMIGEQQTLGEKNPMLGWRGVRYCLFRRQLFKNQLKAIYRASAFGSIRILLPMVSTIGEILEVKSLIEEVKTELRQSAHDFNEKIPLGIMIEVPSAAIMAKTFARYIDFMSIGTNDLTQYIMASDRENTKVADLASYFNPAVLQVLKTVIESEKYITSNLYSGAKISMCGEMASDEVAATLLFALGLRSFSMQIRKLAHMKSFFARMSLSDAQKILAQCDSLVSAEEIRRCVLSGLAAQKYR